VPEALIVGCCRALVVLEVLTSVEVWSSRIVVGELTVEMRRSICLGVIVVQIPRSRD